MSQSAVTWPTQKSSEDCCELIYHSLILFWWQGGSPKFLFRHGLYSSCWNLWETATSTARLADLLLHWWTMRYPTIFVYKILRNSSETSCKHSLTSKSKITIKSTSWSSDNAFVSGAGGLRFDSRAGQIGLSVANGLPPLRHFFESSCVARTQWRGDGAANSLHASA